MSTRTTQLYNWLARRASEHAMHCELVARHASVLDTLPGQCRVDEYSMTVQKDYPLDADGHFDYTRQTDVDVLVIDVNYAYDDDGEYQYSAPDPTTLPWAQRIKPIGAVLRAYHAHNIKRKIDDYGQVTYNADGTVPMSSTSNQQRAVRLRVRITSGGIAPTCKVETVETQELVTRRRVVVTCA